MASPFPGMDPYLERPSRWRSAHTWFATALGEVLGPRLRPRYYVSVEERFEIVDAVDEDQSGIADVLVARQQGPGHEQNGLSNAYGGNGASQREADGHSAVLTVEVPVPERMRRRYLEIRSAEDHQVVTVVEILSPTNKRPSSGRVEYETKRQAVFASDANLVELDLLRSGEPLPLLHMGAPLSRDRSGDYRILISRAASRPRADLYVVTIREPLPEIPIPLRPGDDEPTVDLQDVLSTVYDRGSYDLRIDYHTDPVPPLSPEDAAWADHLLREHGLRQRS